MLEYIVIGACIGILLGLTVTFFWGDKIYKVLDKVFDKLGIF